MYPVLSISTCSVLHVSHRVPQSPTGPRGSSSSLHGLILKASSDLYYWRLGGAGTPLGGLPATGKSFHFVRACDAHCLDVNVKSRCKRKARLFSLFPPDLFPFPLRSECDKYASFPGFLNLLRQAQCPGWIRLFYNTGASK